MKDVWRGGRIEVTAGRGKGESAQILSNTADTITITGILTAVLGVAFVIWPSWLPGCMLLGRLLLDVLECEMSFWRERA